LARAGFNGVTLMYLEGHYPSKIYAWKDANDKTDWLRKWLEAAHKHGLKTGLFRNTAG
jgi:hypothetical protein